MTSAIPRNAWRALFAAQIGWMLDAMDFLLFTFALLPIQKEFGLSSATMGGLSSVALIAGAIGGIAFGRIADRIGRVRAMTFSILLYSGATAGLATSHALWQLIMNVIAPPEEDDNWTCRVPMRSPPAAFAVNGIGDVASENVARYPKTPGPDALRS